jgi:hypothetical protein
MAEDGFGVIAKAWVETAKLIFGDDYFDRLAMKQQPGDERHYQADPYKHMQVDKPAKAH